MKTKKIEVELEYNDLVTLLADSTYTYHYISIDYPEEKDYLNSSSCFEENLANVLLNGGYIRVTDNNDSVPVKKWKAKKNIIDYELCDDEDYCLNIYKLTLNDIKKAVQTEKGYSLMKELLSREGDFWTAYNIIQIALFKDIIYG